MKQEQRLVAETTAALRPDAPPFVPSSLLCLSTTGESQRQPRRKPRRRSRRGGDRFRNWNVDGGRGRRRATEENEGEFPPLTTKAAGALQSPRPTASFGSASAITTTVTATSVSVPTTTSYADLVKATAETDGRWRRRDDDDDVARCDGRVDDNSGRNPESPAATMSSSSSSYWESSLHYRNLQLLGCGRARSGGDGDGKGTGTATDNGGGVVDDGAADRVDGRTVRRRRRFLRTDDAAAKLRDRWWDILRRYEADREEKERQRRAVERRRLEEEAEAEQRERRRQEKEGEEQQKRQLAVHDMRQKQLREANSSAGGSGTSDTNDTAHRGSTPIDAVDATDGDEDSVSRIRSDARRSIETGDVEGLGRALRRLRRRQERRDSARALFFCRTTDTASTGGGDCRDTSCSTDCDRMSLVQLAVYLDQPRLLRMMLRYAEVGGGRSGGVSVTDAQQEEDECNPATIADLRTAPRPPLLLAAQYGYDECLQVLAAEYGSASIPICKDADGNNVLHVGCEHGQLPVLRYFLDFHATLLPKLFLSRNRRGQTPLHVACQEGQVHTVETILGNVGLALLSKILAVQDERRQTPLLAAVASHSTDTVMSLFMWRGNNYYPVSSLPQHQQQKEDAPPCPMEWAVRAGNLDMILLLLEFNSGPSSETKGYDLTRSLWVAATESQSHCQSQVTTSSNEIVRVLIEAGANPCFQPSFSDGATTGNNNIPPKSAVVEAAVRHDPVCLATLLDSYEKHLARIRRDRRRDPVLQKQPESFFAGMESRENAERASAMRDALASVLFYCFAEKRVNDGVDVGLSAYFLCAQVLYRRGADLGMVGIDRLVASTTAGSLVPVSVVPSIVNDVCTYQARYVHPPVPDDNSGMPLEDHRSYWSHLMMSLRWMREDVYAHTECRWILETGCRGCKFSAPDMSSDPDVALVSEDGFHFLAHSLVVREKSDKLAAAIRFASMAESSNSVIEIKIAASKKLCKWMMQHIYHGSVACGLPSDEIELAQELADLLLLAEEFLCPTLVQECELRLLSSEPRRCFCPSCARATVGKDEQSLYRVSSPSLCITSDTVLDILLVAMSVSISCFPAAEAAWNDAPLAMWAPWKNDDAVQLAPTEALREAAARTILMHFDSVTNSEIFSSYQEMLAHQETFENDPSALKSMASPRAENQSHSVKEVLLRLCLEQLVQSPLATARTRKWQNRVTAGATALAAATCRTVIESCLISNLG